MSLIVFVDEVDDDLDHCVLFFGAAFGDHEGEGNKGVVGYALGSADLAEVYDLFVKSCGLVIDGVDDFEFEGFGIILVCHEAGENALEKSFVNASGGDMVDDCFHALHEAIGVPIIAVMNEEPDAYGQGHSLIGILEVMPGA